MHFNVHFRLAICCWVQEQRGRFGFLADKTKRIKLDMPNVSAERYYVCHL